MKPKFTLSALAQQSMVVVVGCGDAVHLLKLGKKSRLKARWREANPPILTELENIYKKNG